MWDAAHSLTRDQCLSRLSECTVGRVSVSKDALPVIVPVVYVQDRTGVVFSSPLDPGFAKLCDRAVIAFEVGDVGAASGVGWSVQVIGVASLVGAGHPESDQTAHVNLARISGHEVRSV
jgi:uncharacterized protein